jgi:hypothetical protein
MGKLPISIGILAWNSGQVLVDTLTTYYNNGLLEMVNDVKILFQEVNEQDKEIANHFSIPYIGLNENIGIGKAFIKLTENSQSDYILILEHDWNLIENRETTYNILYNSYKSLEKDLDVVRLRHRKSPGVPHFSFQYQGRELDYYDSEIECTSPHLLDSIHWCDPDQKFPNLINKKEDIFWTTSRYGNWTNNPCLYKKQFYLDIIKPFAGNGIELEGNISRWWAKQNYKVGHGEGLFTHNDWLKYKNI